MAAAKLNIRSDLHSIESDRALLKPFQSGEMAMRKKGKKVRADYDNFFTSVVTFSSFMTTESEKRCVAKKVRINIFITLLT